MIRDDEHVAPLGCDLLSGGEGEDAEPKLEISKPAGQVLKPA